MNREFSDLLGAWNLNVPEHIDYKCTYNQNIITWHRFLKNKRYHNQDLTVTGKDYVTTGKEFISFLATIPKINQNLEEINNMIVNDENYQSVIHSLIKQINQE
jgi:hypothetical protein